MAVTDYFARLDEPRRPWLEPAALEQKFLALSAEVHPDRVHNRGETERRAAQERYVELNAAYRCLREPRDRLRHLLELERGTRPADLQKIPSGLMDFFMEFSQVCRQADTVLAEKAALTSPLLKVQFFERSQGECDRLRELQQRVTARREELLTELRRLDGEWVADRAEPRDALLGRLEELYRLFGYFDRWTAQVQERMVKLSF